MGIREAVISTATATKSAVIGHTMRLSSYGLRGDKGAIRRLDMGAIIASIRYSQRSRRLETRTDSRFWKPDVALAPSQSTYHL